MLIKSISRSVVILGCLFLAASDPRAAGPRDSLLVTPADLSVHLKDPDLVILQVGEKATYDAGHIPGARLVEHSSVGFAAPRDPKELNLELPSPESLHEKLASLGVTDRSRIVVVYSDQYYSPSTRVILTLSYAGFGERTKLLEGGMGAWKKAGYPTTTDVPAFKPGTLSPLKTEARVVDAAFVQAIATKPNVVLVDGRDAPFYDGVMASMGGTARGHIPGAVSIPYDSVFNESESLRPVAELEAIFAKAGVKPGDTIVGYCHVGQQATAMLFAARTLGHDVLLYDGSMNDWSRRKLPLEVKK